MTPVAHYNDMRTIAHEVAAIEAIVVQRLAGRVRNFRLVADADGLVLIGESCTFHAKQLAQRFVMDLTPVPILANQIVVA